MTEDQSTGPGYSAPVRVVSAKVSHTIVRACEKCGGARETGVACASCGNRRPAKTVELGVVSATYRNPIRKWFRHVIGDPLARRRIKRANVLTAALQRGADKWPTQ